MEIVYLKVKTLKQLPLYKEMFGSPIISELSSLDEAYERKRKTSPILYMDIMEGNIEIPYVIDGWKSVVIHDARGIETIPAIRVDLENPEELPYLLADLHTNYHNSPEEDFKKFTYFYGILSLGKGHRSDLKGAEGAEVETEVETEVEITEWTTTESEEVKPKKKRSADVYEKIARFFGVKRHYVQAILKIGKKNPLYFERLRSGRISAFQAYNDCLTQEKKERGEIPLSTLPKVSMPVYVSDATEVPIYDQPTATTYISDDTTDETTKVAENKIALDEVFDNLIVTVTAAELSAEGIILPPTQQFGSKTIQCDCPHSSGKINVLITKLK